MGMYPCPYSWMAARHLGWVPACMPVAPSSRTKTMTARKKLHPHSVNAACSDSSAPAARPLRMTRIAYPHPAKITANDTTAINR